MTKRALLALVVAALGYFVDVYDLILFNVVRLASFKEIGVAPADMLSTGVFLLNVQNAGLLIGGVLWGIIGDKRGRLTVLFGSIVLYSVANASNAFVHSVPPYAVLRFIAGVGLAGELGAGVTLVAEVLPTRSRGIGTMIVACAGMLGGITGAMVGDKLPWRTAYIVGGALGMGLLLLRIGVVESGLFVSLKDKSVRRGDFFTLFSKKNIVRYLSAIVVGMPVWLSFGILIAFSPEISKERGMTDVPTVGRAILFWYTGMFLGDLGSGLASQLLRSRKKALAIWLALSCVAITLYFTPFALSSRTSFDFVCWLLGFSSGYWAVFVTVASENFGTNIRSTVTTTVPNFVRGAIILLTMGFKLGRPHLGIVGSAIVVSVATMFVSGVSLRGIRETFDRDLDFVD